MLQITTNICVHGKSNSKHITHTIDSKDKLIKHTVFVEVVKLKLRLERYNLLLIIKLKQTIIKNKIK